MSELRDPDERPPPDWEACSRHDDDGCIGIRISTTAYCLAHLEHQAPEEFKAFLTRLRPGASLDLRGTQLSSELLDQLLNALKTEEQPPTIKQARFDQAQFIGPAKFEKAQFSGDAGFEGARFTEPARFDGTRFSGPAGFEGAQFKRIARFVGAQFIGPATFENAGFSGDARFGGARFSRDAQFGGGRFTGPARFDGALFSGPARFGAARFSGDAGFRRAQFSGPAWFVGGRFNGDAGFENAQFSRDAGFTRARFSGDARFSRAQFSEDAGFKQAQFSGPARFDGAQVSRVAKFEGVQFTATTSLGPLRADLLVLDGASFGASVVVDVAARRLSMVGTRFEQEATLRVQYADVLLDGAAFAKPSLLAFAESPLLPALTPTDEQPASQQSLEPQPQGPLPVRGSTLNKARLKERPRLLSLRRVDVTNLVLGDLDLTWCLFRGTLNLDKLRIQGPKDFETTPRGWRWTHRRTLTEERQWRQTRYSHEDWRLPSDEALGWVDAQSGQPVQKTPDPEDVAPLYRALRKAEEDAKYEPGAADFYYGEMEMRRHARGTPWVEKWLLWAYWLVAGYGLRGLRAVVSLLVVVLGLAALFQWVGFRGHPPGPWYWGSVLYAAKSTLSLPVQEQLTGWGEVLRILLRLSGPLLLGLALLSVRGRVKR